MTTKMKISDKIKALFMAIIILSLFFMSSFSGTKRGASELTDTKWKAIMNIPDPVECTMVFKKDSMILYDQTSVLETSSYQLKGDTILFKKLSGISPCDDLQGIYQYKLKNDILIFTTIKDDCVERSGAFPADGFKKVAK